MPARRRPSRRDAEIPLALTFDDVLLLPAHSRVHPRDVDLSTGTWSCAGTASERRRELRILRDGGLLLPWADLFGASWQARALLSREARTGRDGSRASALSAYVVQAVAAAEYAYSAEGGALRRAYADLVTSYNLGRAEGLTVFQAFGLTPEALGARVEAWTAR